jgi:ribosomal protein L28
MAVCEICGKKTVIGRRKQHKRGVAGRRWKKRAQVTIRKFKPNIHSATIMVGNKRKKVKICSKCLKRYKKDNPDHTLTKTALG